MPKVTKVILNSGYNATPLNSEHYLLTARGDCLYQKKGYTYTMNYKKFGFLGWGSLVSSWSHRSGCVLSVEHKKVIKGDWL